MNRILITLGLSSALLLGGCSGGNEDVRITFCKDLGAELLGQPKTIEWTDSQNQSGRFTDLTMTLGYNAGDKSGNIQCVYELEEDQESSLADFDPLAPYATLPHKASLNGATIGNQKLAKAIQATLIKQGKDLADEIKKRSNKAASELSAALKATLNQ